MRSAQSVRHSLQSRCPRRATAAVRGLPRNLASLLLTRLSQNVQAGFPSTRSSTSGCSTQAQQIQKSLPPALTNSVRLLSRQKEQLGIVSFVGMDVSRLALALLTSRHRRHGCDCPRRIVQHKSRPVREKVSMHVPQRDDAEAR